ncbi:MAG: hypothetical protein BZ135_01655 [Methanosphaera sp. rholeuAM6]|nr:MAG: hypothetical protein BZ135_01655 [Methanosphaera sp. rholeuAM6]
MIKNEYYYEMNELANECRREWFINENVPIDIFNVIMNKFDDVTIVFMNMENISGASTIIGKSKLIFINSKESYARQRFNIAHELYHLRFDNRSVTCTGEENKENENKADQFASCLLLPHGALCHYEKINHLKNNWTLEDIINAEQFFQISHQAFIWRLRLLEKITFEDYNKFKVSIKNKALNMGYDTKLYQPYHETNCTMGSYINKVNKLFDKDLISPGLRDELLLDAFYYDKVW